MEREKFKSKISFFFYSNLKMPRPLLKAISDHTTPFYGNKFEIKI